MGDAIFKCKHQLVQIGNGALQFFLAAAERFVALLQRNLQLPLHGDVAGGGVKESFIGKWINFPGQ